MSTRERIVYEALVLFSKKGYSDVYVAEIASAVGIKAPSLYKHFKSKQDIFNECVKFFYRRMEDAITKNNADNDFTNISTDELIEKVCGMFEFYLEDEIAKMFRRMLMIGRYNNEQLNEIYEKIFIVDAIKYEEDIFSKLIEGKKMKAFDPHVLALQFYEAVCILIQKYDMHPDLKEEGLKELRLTVSQFCKSYGL